MDEKERTNRCLEFVDPDLASGFAHHMLVENIDEP